MYHKSSSKPNKRPRKAYTLCWKRTKALRSPGDCKTLNKALQKTVTLTPGDLSKEIPAQLLASVNDGGTALLTDDPEHSSFELKKLFLKIDGKVAKTRICI